MPVTQEERAYMRRIAAYKALSAAEDGAAHAACAGPERVRRSWELFLRYRDSPFIEKDEDDDWPARFYEQARRLGLDRS